MKHIYWIYKDEVAGRPGPGFAPWRLEDLKREGFDTMLSVASDLFRHTEVIDAGFLRTCIPFPDVVPPDKNTIEICSKALPLAYNFIRTNIEKGRKVLVHCAGGNDRTGLVLSYYIARRESIDAKAAIVRLRTVRPTALSANGWEKMALELMDEL